MKKMFLQKGFRSFLPMLLLFVGMAFSSHMSAQNTAKTPHNWVSTQQAIDNLTNQVVNVLLPAYNTQDPNSQTGQATYRKMFYYKTVVGELQGGATVEGALDTALEGISVGPTGLRATEGALTLTKAQQMQLYIDAAALVSL